jgi:WD40 repeat protein
MLKATLGGHASAAQQLVFLPGGKTLASAAHRELVLWDLAEVKVKTTRRLEEGRPTFSANGARYAVVERHGVAVYELESGRQLAFIEKLGNKNNIVAVALSADGRRVAFGEIDLEPSWEGVRVADISTGEELARWPIEDDFLYAITFAPDGETVVGGDYRWAPPSAGGRLYDRRALTIVTDGLTGRELFRLSDPDRPVRSTWHTRWRAVSPDGRFIAWGAVLAGSNAVQYPILLGIWDLDNRRRVPTSWDGKDVSLGEFSPDGKLLAVADSKGVVRCIDVTATRRAGGPEKE